MRAVGWGLAALVLIIVALDQLVWRPLLAWSDRFKLELVEGEVPFGSWFYEVLLTSRIIQGFQIRIGRPLNERLDAVLLRLFPARATVTGKKCAPVAALSV